MADIFDEIQFSDRDYKDILMKNPKALWFQRAVTNPARTKDRKSVFTTTTEADGKYLVVPTVRLNKKGELYEFKNTKEAIKYAMKEQDYITADSPAEAEFISKGFSGWQGRRND